MDAGTDVSRMGKALGQGGLVTTARAVIMRARLLAAGVLGGDGDRARVQRDVVAAFLVRAVSAAILYLTQIVLARWMGRAEYGIYVAVWTMVLVLGGTGNLGLSTAIIRLLPELREKGDIARARGLVRFGRLMALAAGTVIAVAGLAVLRLIPEVVTAPYMLPVFLALVCVPLVALSDIHDGVGRGAGWIGIALLPPYVLRPLLVLLAMVVAHETGWPMTAETAAGAAIIATWVAAAVQTVLVERRLRATLGSGTAAIEARTWTAIALPLLALSFSELVLQTADVLIMSRYLAPAEVAVYFAASKTMSLVMFVHYAVGSAVANRFSTLNTRGDRAELVAFVGDAVRWTFWPSLAVAGSLLLLGLPLLWLFGPEFTAGYPLMFVLAVGFLGRAAMGPSEFLLGMLGEHRTCAAIAATAAGSSIGLNFLLVPPLGSMGAAIATATAMLIGAMLNTFAARRRLGLEIAIWARGR